MPNSVAIITGVSKGLGLELAIHLVATKYIVVGVSRLNPSDQRLLEAISEGKVYHIQGDVSEEMIARRSFDKGAELGNVEFVINCAGEGIFGPAGSYNKKDIDDVMRGNLVGTILFSETAFNRFKSSGVTIVNVMSTASQVARANEAIYCASKWGARGYTESIRLETKGTAVKVIAVYPGGMNTGFWTTARGAEVDARKFMPPSEVASIIMDAIKTRQGSYVSDIIINRK